MDNKYCGGVEVMEKSWVHWTSGGLSMSGDYSVLFIQKANRDFLYYWDYVVGTGLCEVSVGYFVLVKEDVKLDKFYCLPFLFNPSITEQKKTSYFYGTGHILYLYS